MTEKELADLHLELGRRENYFWNFFTVFALGLAGVIIKFGEGTGDPFRLPLVTGYLAFAAMNVSAHWNTSSMQMALQEDIAGLPEPKGRFLQSCATRDYRKSRIAMIVIHAALLILMGIVVLSA